MKSVLYGLLVALALLLSACSQNARVPVLDTDIPEPELLSIEALDAYVKAGLAEKFEADFQYYSEDSKLLDGILQPQQSTYADCYGWVGVSAYPFSSNAYARVYIRCPGYTFKTTIPDSYITAFSPPDPNGVIKMANKQKNEVNWDTADVLSNSL